jgi:hypothetical protein
VIAYQLFGCCDSNPQTLDHNQAFAIYNNTAPKKQICDLSCPQGVNNYHIFFRIIEFLLRFEPRLPESTNRDKATLYYKKAFENRETEPDTQPMPLHWTRAMNPF